MRDLEARIPARGHRGGVPAPKDRRRRKYAEYDPFKAQDEVNENNANKGTRMRVTNQMAFLFRRHVIDEKLSPYDALCHMKEEMPGQDIPCLSTWYKHINASNTITQAQAVNNLIAAIGGAGQSFIANMTQLQQADATAQGAQSKKSEEELDQTKDLFNQALTLVDSIVKLMQAVRAAEAQSMRDAIQA